MEKKLIAYTDGSYNSTTGYYGCGAVLIDENEQEIARMHKTGKPDAGANGWNINGEIEAAVMAIHTAIGLGCKELTIYHDYEGVANGRMAYGKQRNPIQKPTRNKFMNFVKRSRSRSFT